MKQATKGLVNLYKTSGMMKTAALSLFDHYTKHISTPYEGTAYKYDVDSHYPAIMASLINFPLINDGQVNFLEYPPNTRVSGKMLFQDFVDLLYTVKYETVKHDNIFVSGFARISPFLTAAARSKMANLILENVDDISKKEYLKNNNAMVECSVCHGRYKKYGKSRRSPIFSFSCMKTRRRRGTGQHCGRHCSFYILNMLKKKGSLSTTSITSVASGAFISSSFTGSSWLNVYAGDRWLSWGDASPSCLIAHPLVSLAPAYDGTVPAL